MNRETQRQRYTHRQTLREKSKGGMGEEAGQRETEGGGAERDRERQRETERDLDRLGRKTHSNIFLERLLDVLAHGVLVQDGAVG